MVGVHPRVHPKRADTEVCPYRMAVYFKQLREEGLALRGEVLPKCFVDDLLASRKLGFRCGTLPSLKLKFNEPAMPPFVVGFNGKKLLGKVDSSLQFTSHFILFYEFQQGFKRQQPMFFSLKRSPLNKSFGILHVYCFQKITSVQFDCCFWLLGDGLLENGRIYPHFIRRI